MKLHFEPDLEYQKAAVNAVCDLFKGQELCRSEFTVIGNELSTQLSLTDIDGKRNQLGLGPGEHLGIGNKLQLLDDELLQNLNEIQLRNGLKPSESLDSKDFTVEMETGTGKTYVYLRSIFQLHQKYGFTKFVIVVPSVAIKEGVYKTLQITQDHFKALFINAPYEFFLYDSSKLWQVRDFATSPNIQIMVVTVGAINKKDVNNLYKDSEKTGGEKPIDLIRETRPILIVDEPQSVDGGLLGEGKKALVAMNPLCTLRYSATHTAKHHMVYRLDAVDAYDQKLVKQIEVASLQVEGGHNKGYIKLIGAENKRGTISAKVEVDVQSGNKVTRKIITIKPGQDLFEVTGRAIYADQLVEAIGCRQGEEFLELSNLEEPLRIGKAIGDVDEDDVKRLMIQRTIEEHFDKELRLGPKGIKVLSLFFIDHVDFYRTYEEGIPQKGKYALMFEEEFKKSAQKAVYKRLFKGQNLDIEAAEAHNGYFSIDKKGIWSNTEESTAATRDNAERAYNLIMKHKEKLLSFDTKLRFIFSHSALREGWDNPNVFQICAIREIATERERRQTIGRGLRLCVNQEGERLRGFENNTLTVIATEGYEEFAEGLQREIERDTGIHFGLVEKHQFASIPITNEEGRTVSVGINTSEKIWLELKDAGFLDDKGHIQDKLRQCLKDGTFELSGELKEYTAPVSDILRKLAGKLEIKNAGERKIVKVKKNVLDSPEFKALWDRIRAKTTYRVDFDNEQLINDCVRALKNCPSIAETYAQIRKADIAIERGGVSSAETSASAPILIRQSGILLPDLLTDLQNKTQLTRKSIVRILIESDRLADFQRNPQQFIELAAESINRTKRLALVDGIKYQRIGADVYYAQELFEQDELVGYLKNMVAVEHGLHEYVLYDSAGIERSFGEELDKNEAVKLYAKLPRWFEVPTPLGAYIPDWAVVIETAGEERLYFVVETKGSLYGDDLRNKEKAKIECGKVHFKAIASDETAAKFVLATEVRDLMIECL